MACVARRSKKCANSGLCPIVAFAPRTDEREPRSGSGFARRRAVFGVANGNHFGGRASEPEFDKGSDDDAHHLFEKRRPEDVDFDERFVALVRIIDREWGIDESIASSRDVDLNYRSDGGFGLAIDSSERRKIVRTDEVLSRQSHVVDVEFSGSSDAIEQVRWHEVPFVERVSVVFSAAGESGLEGGWCDEGASDEYFWGRRRVERLDPAIGGIISIGFEGGNLVLCMDAGIGTAGTAHRGGGVINLRNRSLEAALNGAGASLSLPARKRRAVVGDDENYRLHRRLKIDRRHGDECFRLSRGNLDR